MKEKMLSLVDAMRCAEQKIRECKAQREPLMAKVAELNEAISYQEAVLNRNDQDLDVALRSATQIGGNLKPETAA